VLIGTPVMQSFKTEVTRDFEINKSNGCAPPLRSTGSDREALRLP
jgi:hypothetical protein